MLRPAVCVLLFQFQQVLRRLFSSGKEVDGCLRFQDHAVIGNEVAQVGKVLTFDDFDSVQIRGRRNNGTVDDAFGVVQCCKLTASPSDKRQVESIAGQTAGSTHALHIGGNSSGQ